MHLRKHLTSTLASIGSRFGPSQGTSTLANEHSAVSLAPTYTPGFEPSVVVRPLADGYWGDCSTTPRRLQPRDPTYGSNTARGDEFVTQWTMSEAQWKDDKRSHRTRDDMTTTANPDGTVTITTRQDMPRLTKSPPVDSPTTEAKGRDSEIDSFGFHIGTLNRITEVEKGNNPYYTEPNWAAVQIKALVEDFKKQQSARAAQTQTATATSPSSPNKSTTGAPSTAGSESTAPVTDKTDTATSPAETIQSTRGVTPGHLTGSWKSLQVEANKKAAALLTDHEAQDTMRKINEESHRMTFEDIDTTDKTLTDVWTELTKAHIQLQSAGAKSTALTVEQSLRNTASLWTPTATEADFTSRKKVLADGLESLWTNLRETATGADEGVTKTNRDLHASAADEVKRAAAYLNSQTWDGVSTHQSTFDTSAYRTDPETVDYPEDTSEDTRIPPPRRAGTILGPEAKRAKQRIAQEFEARLSASRGGAAIGSSNVPATEQSGGSTLPLETTLGRGTVGTDASVSPTNISTGVQSTGQTNGPPSRQSAAFTDIRGSFSSLSSIDQAAFSGFDGTGVAASEDMSAKAHHGTTTRLSSLNGNSTSILLDLSTNGFDATELTGKKRRVAFAPNDSL